MVGSALCDHCGAEIGNREARFGLDGLIKEIDGGGEVSRFALDAREAVERPGSRGTRMAISSYVDT
jgi:hypothetical protein